MVTVLLIMVVTPGQEMCHWQDYQVEINIKKVLSVIITLCYLYALKNIPLL